MNIDIVSDLHIDHWSNDIPCKYPYGVKKHFPLNVIKSDSDYLIVAGDISDDINLSVDYLNYISKYYKKILFVDGNHEHVNNYPNLYDYDTITNLLNNDKIVFLSKNPYVINKKVFIGCCGWWDYCNEDQEIIKNDLKYFNKWIKDFKEKESLEFIYNVINRSREEYNILIENLEKYTNNDAIEEIIIVTHTIPDLKYSDVGSEGSQFNSKFKNVCKYKKVTNWIFGHTHQKFDEFFNNVKITCNPRGRPDDFDREIYSISKITI